MKRLLILIFLLAATHVAAAEKSVSIERDFGTLQGSLLIPEGGSQTVALIIAGSGPVDRNGNSTQTLRSNSYLFLAQALEKAGIASLRYDKRGIGASRYNEVEKMAEVVLDDFTGDVTAWADYLAAEGFQRIILIGHSEGALLALCAAQHTENVSAVISLAGAGYPIDEILQLQLAAQLAPANMEMLMQATNIIASLKQGRRVESYPPELAPLFTPAVQPFLISWMRYDPRTEIRKLTIPVLIVNGDNDRQVSVDNAEALAKAQPQARLSIIPDMTHPLKKSKGRTLPEQMPVYTDNTLPLDPDLAAVVVGFINGL